MWCVLKVWFNWYFKTAVKLLSHDPKCGLSRESEIANTDRLSDRNCWYWCGVVMNRRTRRIEIWIHTYSWPHQPATTMNTRLFTLLSPNWVRIWITYFVIKYLTYTFEYYDEYCACCRFKHSALMHTINSLNASYFTLNIFIQMHFIWFLFKTARRIFYFLSQFTNNFWASTHTQIHSWCVKCGGGT